MPANNITIKFKSSGDPKLLRALKNLAKAQDELTRTTKKYGKVQDNTGKKGRLLNNTFATMRSKLLLVNFAMAMGIKQLIDFTKQAAKVESMSRAFNTLSGGVESGTVALEKLKAATNGTMNEFDLFQQANNAMVLGITKNSDEMAEMFDIAQRLGRALGVDTKRSVESLITGIGRQSRLMLDNIGIIVKADEAYGKYAEKLGTTADKLSDADKKTAFLEATMESARAKVALLGAETESSQDSFDRFSATMSDLSVLVGERLKGAFSGAMDAFVKFVEINKDADVETALASNQYSLMAITVERLEHVLKESTRAAQHQGIAFNQGINIYTLSALEVEKLKKEIVSLQVEMAKMTMIQPFADDIFTQFPGFERLFQSNIEVMDNFNQDAEALLNDFWQNRHSVSMEAHALEKSALEQAANDTIDDAEVLQSVLLSIHSHFANIKAQGDLERHNEHMARLKEQGAALMSMQPQKIELDSQDMIRSNMLESAKTQVFEMEKRGFIESGDAYSEYQKKVKVIDAVILKSKLRATSGMLNSFKALNDAAGGSAKASARLAQISASIDMYAGANKAFAQGGVMGFITGAAIIAQGLANIVQIEKNIGKYEQGGLVGGRRHSSGGTMIEAERGEFVMSRNAVDAIGLEAMNRINAGGGGGAVSINFTGNVMSQDFIEDEAIPMIKEAIRRGADIGVA
jgi:hypothetical protein